jgi:hypothetical protein
MYNVQDYSAFYNNTVMFEGWHFTRMWKALA